MPNTTEDDRVLIGWRCKELHDLIDAVPMLVDGGLLEAARDVLTTMEDAARDVNDALERTMVAGELCVR